MLIGWNEGEFVKEKRREVGETKSVYLRCAAAEGE